MEFRDTISIVSCNEDMSILWVSFKDVINKADAFEVFKAFFIETGGDSYPFDEMEGFFKNVETIFGHWEPIPDNPDGISKWIDDEVGGEVWYRLDMI